MAIGDEEGITNRLSPHARWESSPSLGPVTIEQVTPEAAAEIFNRLKEDYELAHPFKPRTEALPVGYVAGPDTRIAREQSIAAQRARYDATFRTAVQGLLDGGQPQSALQRAMAGYDNPHSILQLRPDQQQVVNERLAQLRSVGRNYSLDQTGKLVPKAPVSSSTT